MNINFFLSNNVNDLLVQNCLEQSYKAFIIVLYILPCSKIIVKYNYFFFVSDEIFLENLVVKSK